MDPYQTTYIRDMHGHKPLTSKMEQKTHRLFYEIAWNQTASLTIKVNIVQQVNLSTQSEAIKWHIAERKNIASNHYCKNNLSKDITLRQMHGSGRNLAVYKRPTQSVGNFWRHNCDLLLQTLFEEFFSLSLSFSKKLSEQLMTVLPSQVTHWLGRSFIYGEVSSNSNQCRTIILKMFAIDE